MHELTIAKSLIDLACKHAREQGANRVTRLHVRLGTMSVVLRSLYACFGPATRGTLCENASLDVDQALGYAWRVNPDLESIRVSARTGEGMNDWIAWLENRHRAMLESKIATLDAAAGDLRKLLPGDTKPAKATKPFTVVSGG